GSEYARSPRAISLAGMYVHPSSEEARRRQTPQTRRVGVQSAVHVTDTWPDDLPISPAELQAVEAWLGEVLDEVLGPRL
ncbi:hypothetical protein, partial [Escherichia coli]|uniref:hypothetical protein n=1 Tax=Escherichia coli TaxID=562 RepID=UPI001BFD0CC8